MEHQPGSENLPSKDWIEIDKRRAFSDKARSFGDSDRTVRGELQIQREVKMFLIPGRGLVQRRLFANHTKRLYSSVSATGVQDIRVNADRLWQVTG